MNTLRMKMLAAFVALVAVACKQYQSRAKAGVRSGGQAGPAAESAPASARTAEAGWGPGTSDRSAVWDPNSILTHRSVYFDYDRSVIHDPIVPVVEAHGRYLVDHPPRTVRSKAIATSAVGASINLALGQRRAMRCASGSATGGFV